jgi:hypothetical protein
VATFIETVTRIASELNRSNITADIKNAINDAIAEAATTRFYFNEMRGLTFNTVALQEYYPDLGIVEFDAVWYFQGVNSRRNVEEISNLDMDRWAEGSVIGGQLTEFSRYGQEIRLYPIPSTVQTIYMSGYGKLTPSPLVNDGDTNAWLTDGERYIRALAKRNVLQNKIRDFSEAAVQDAIANDYKDNLTEASALRAMGAGSMTPTQF